MMVQKGAVSVRAMATHAVLSGPAYDNIARSALQEVILSDTIPLRHTPGQDISKIKVLSVAELFADLINKVYNYQSISSKFLF
jgi:ribose-phosphate pyrophosphokinase